MLSIHPDKKSGLFFKNLIVILNRVLISSVLLISLTSVAQTSRFSPSFEKTNKLINDGKLEEAYKQMKVLQISYPRHFITKWKTAQLAYWTWDIDNAKKYYEQAIKLDSTHQPIKYEYAKMLFVIGEYPKATRYFEEYRKVEPENPEVWLYNIKSLYYNNQLAEAAKLFKQLPASLIYNYDLTLLRDEILVFGATNINFSTSYTNDNQPLQTFSPKIRISKRHSSYFNWYVEGQFNQFSNDTLKGNSQTLRLGNQFIFDGFKLNADVHVGATFLPNANESTFIGGINLVKKITKGIDLNAEFSRNPYYSSLPSVSDFVFHDNVGFSLSVRELKKFSGNIQILKQKFNDDNTIDVKSFWILSPAIGKNKFNLRVGYAFESMDSENDNFTSIKSVPEILQDFSTSTTIKGIYKSYFTPQNQQIHNAVLAIQYAFNPKLNFNFRGSYGVKAKWDNPYLFLEENSNNEIFVEKDFITQNFNPSHYNAELKYSLNKKWDLGLNYNYFKTAFYSANTVLINLNYKIISEK